MSHRDDRTIEVVADDREALQRVAGIGVTTAATIRWAVREVGAPYLGSSESRWGRRSYPVTAVLSPNFFA